MERGASRSYIVKTANEMNYQPVMIQQEEDGPLIDFRNVNAPFSDRRSLQYNNQYHQPMIIPQRSYMYLNGQDEMMGAANNLTDRRSSARTTSKKKKKSKTKKGKKSESPN